MTDEPRGPDGPAEMLANRLRKNLARLRSWLRQSGVTCYRLYDRDIPEIPLIIDRYEGKLCVAEFERPSTRTPPEQEAWLEQLLQAAAGSCGVDRQDVFLRRRARQRGTRQYQRLGQRQVRFLVREQGLNFWVNLSDYLDTGLFLDHRPTRQLVREEADGKNVLNLYAYTGAFSVYAAAGGARTTTTVDLSPTYLRWAEDNLRANGLLNRRHCTIRAEAGEFLREEEQAGRRYDLIVLDPPTFSNSKRTPVVLDLQRDHGRLLRQVLAVTAPGGVVYFSTNFRQFRLDASALTDVQVTELTDRTIPPDFRDTRIHRCWRIVAAPPG